MSSMKLRPTFEIPLDWNQAEAMERLREAFRQPPLAGRVTSMGTVADFRVPHDQQRLWSPHLSIQVEDRETGSGLLHGRFSPRPEIWTGVMLFYVSVLFLMLCGMTWAYAQVAMGGAPWALLSVPAGLGLIAGIHFMSLVGQRLSSDQMVELRSLLDLALERARSR